MGSFSRNSVFNENVALAAAQTGALTFMPDSGGRGLPPGLPSPGAIVIDGIDGPTED